MTTEAVKFAQNNVNNNVGILFRSWYTLLTLHEVDTPFQSADQLTGLFDGSSTSRSTCFLELSKSEDLV